MAQPRWKSNWVLSEPLKPFQGDCSRETWQQVIQEERQAKALEFFETYDLSPDDPDVFRKAFEALALEHVTGFQIEDQPGVKADPLDTVQDLILLAGVECAKQKEGFKNVTATIRALKQHNGWKESDSTLRRRYYYLIKDGTPERKRAIGLARGLLPYFEARLEQLEKNKK